MAMISYQQIVTSLSFFQFMTNLEQSRSRIQEGWSVKLTFSSIVSSKQKTKLKNPEHSSHTIALSKGTNFNKKC